jgi:hypothetical protein
LDDDSIAEDFDQYRVDKFNFASDYEPLRLGLKPDKMQIVLEFETPSNSRRFQNFIKLTNYMAANMTLTKNSGSFKD